MLQTDENVIPLKIPTRVSTTKSYSFCNCWHFSNPRFGRVSHGQGCTIFLQFTRIPLFYVLVAFPSQGTQYREDTILKLAKVSDTSFYSFIRYHAIAFE